MIDPLLLDTILRTHRDARFGYCAMDCQTYYRHVGALLEEIDHLNTRLAGATEAGHSDEGAQRCDSK